MSEKTFQQKFGAFALVAAVALLIVNLTVVGPTVFGISTPLLLGVTGIIMMRGERSEAAAAQRMTSAGGSLRSLRQGCCRRIDR